MRLRGTFPAALCLFLMISGALLPSPGGEPGPALRREEGPLPAGGERAVERPDHESNLTSGYLLHQFKGSTKDYYINLKVHYPALTATENATADLSAGPYACVIMLPPFGGPEFSYDGTAPRMVSWGFVCVAIGPNWNDFPNSCNRTDMEEILDWLEGENLTAGSKLFGMVDRERFGIFGYSSGGGLSVLNAALVPRLKALSAFAPAVSVSSVDALSYYFSKPFLIQCGENDSYYRQASVRCWELFPPPKYFLDTRDGTHGGPFYWDCTTSFFLRYLQGRMDYDHYLSGWGAFDDVADNKYDLNFLLQNGSTFPPTITLSASLAAVNESEPVHFSTSFTGAVPLGHPRGAFQYDFESDGTVDLSARTTSAVYEFSTAGNRRVGMWYALGEASFPCQNSVYISVTNLVPGVSLPSAHEGAEDEVIGFVARGWDTPGDNDTLEYAWDFGDGTLEPFGPSPLAGHAYPRGGTCTVRVTVRDNDGATAQASSAVTVTNLPPKASAGEDVMTFKDSEVRLEGKGEDTPSDLPGLRYRWDFGDGFSTDWGFGRDALHAYTSSGNFTAAFLAVDADGAEARSALNVTVLNAPPRALLLLPLENSTFGKDTEVDFDGSGTDTASDLPSLEYSWDFGDGNLSGWSPTPGASHSYTRGGAFTVVFSVRDRDGATASAAANITIHDQPPTVRLLGPLGAEVDEDEEVTFRAEGRDTFSDERELNYTWTIGGEEHFGSSVRLKFTTEGQREFTVTVRDPEGASASASGLITVLNPAPEMTAALSPATILKKGSVHYSVHATDTPSDQDGLNISWDFGDGNASFEAEGSHCYERAGNYTVRVTITDDEGASANDTFYLSVLEPQRPPPPPEADPVRGGLPTTVLAGTGAAAVLVAASIVLLLLRKGKRPA